jgi:hypothetical protein
MMMSAQEAIRIQKPAPRPVPWLWPGRIAAGRLTLIDGDPDQGKSFLTLDLAARLTAGHTLPDGCRPSEPMTVLLLSAEDSREDTIVPRLLAAEADLERVHFWDEALLGVPVFPEACRQLQQVLERTQARLVVIDPFFAFLGQETGSLNDFMIRRALQPLARVAELTQAAIVLIRHLSKVGVTRQAIYRGLGSIAILGMARTAFLVGADPDDVERRVFACTKNNLAGSTPSLGFRIVPAEADMARIEWLGPVDRTADDLVPAGRKRGQAVPRAAAFLREQLAQGPCDREALLGHAEAIGLSFRTLERAKSQLGVVSQQRREGGKIVWYWRLGD